MPIRQPFRPSLEGWLNFAVGLAAALILALPCPVAASIIASDNFDAYTPAKALATQGATGYGWSGGWTGNAGVTLNAVVTDSTGTTDMDCTPAGGKLIPGGTNSVDMTSGGNGTPVVSRQLFLPQTGTFYAACAVRFETGNVNTGDMFGFCLNNDPASMAAGVNIGYYGNPTAGNLFFARAGISTPTGGTTVSSRNGIHYLVVKVEKTGAGNYDKVTLWEDPATGDETNSPNGDFQLTTDLGISSIQQVGIFGQNLDNGDRCRVDSLALATTFADLMGPAGPGPGGGIPVNTIRVEAAADGSANAALPAQNLPLLNNTLTVYAIARNGSGTFLSNTPASWFLTNLTGSVVAGDLVPAPDGKSAVFTSHMAGSAKILAVGSATNLVTSGVITIPAGIDQFDALRLYWWTNLMAGSPSPSTVASTANGYWNSMVTNAGRTYLWSDLPYGANSYNIVATFIRLNAMAEAWAMPGCSLQGNPNLAAAVASGMDWMVANAYSPSTTEYGNWFHWEDSGIQNFESALVLMYPWLTPAELTNYCASLDHFSPPVRSWQTGANTADKVQIVAIRGILGKNASKMATARDNLSPVFPFVTDSDGFYTDGSFVFHTDLAYNGGYGVDLLGKIPTLVNLLQPSQWQITDPNLTNVFFWITAGYEPLFYNGNLIDMVRGRDVAVDSETESSMGAEVLGSIQQIAQFAPAATATALNNFVSSPQLTAGQFDFGNMDRVVAHRANFAFGVSMSSTRIANYESINGNNLHGWFTGDGMTYLYVGSGETQFTGDFWPTVDAYHLPGTTAETNALANAVGEQTTTDQNWVGGAQVAGTYGVAGMSLHPAAVTTTLYGKKSWVMLDNEIVCLGAGITGGDAGGVHTTAENRRLGAPITQSFTLNGTAITPAVGWSSNLPSATASWCALGGTGGYYFPAGQSNLQATFTANSGSWASIDTEQGSSTVYTDDYFKLWYNHGLHPTNATYAYVLLPNFTAGSVSNYALAPDILILTNTASVQAVKKPALGLVAANFWNPGTNSADIITVNNKAAVVVWQSSGNFYVGVADPTQTNAGAITVTLNGSASGLVSADPGVTVVRLSPQIVLSVNVNGAQGKSFQAAFTGLLSSPVYWNLAGGGSWATAADWLPATTPNATGALASFGGGGTALTGPGMVTLDGNQTVGGINFSNGVHGFTVNPGTGGTLTLDNTPGTPLISNQAGSHTLAVPLALTSFGVNVSGAAGSSLVLGGAITGATGGLTVSGNGTVTLTAANACNGTTVASGTLVVTNSGTLGSPTSPLNVNGGLLDLGGTSQTVGPVVIAGGTIQHGTLAGSSFCGEGGTVGANLAGSGTALTNLTGTLTLSGTNSYTGGTTVSGGTLQNGGPSAFTGGSSLTLAGTSVFDLNGFNAVFSNVSAGVNTATITDNSAGAGTTTLAITNDSGTIADLIQDGPGKKVAVVVQNNNSTATLFSLGNNNTFSGGLTLASGYGNGTRLRVSALLTGSPFGGGPVIIGQAPTDKAGILLDTVANNSVTNNIVFNTALGTDVPGIRLDTGGHTFSGTITANQSPALFVGNAAGVTVSLTGQITGTNGLSIAANGSGTQTLTATLNNLTANANNYGGATVISNSRSTLVLGQANQIPNGSGAGNVTNNGTLNLNGCNETINGLNGSGTVDGFSGSPVFTLGGNNAGGLFSGVIANTAGRLSLVKTGTGTQTLSGGNTFSGPTTISAGTLALAGSGAVASSSVITVAGGATFNVLAGGFTIGSGQTLAGAGLVTGGPVTVASGGTLAPGASPGNLTISNRLVLNAGSTNVFTLNPAAKTNAAVLGLTSVSYGGTLQLTNLAGAFTNGNAFKLFYAGSYAGAFATLSPAAPGSGLRWNTNTLATDGTLRITNGPVPRIVRATPQNGRLVLSATNGTPNAATYVQFTTNLANPAAWVRLSTNAFDGTGGLLWSNQIVPSMPATFYRIEAP